MKVVQYDQISKPLITPSGEQISELIGTARGDQSNHSLAYIVIPPGKSSSSHYHRLSEETYFILEGEGRMKVDQQEFVIQPGQACFIKAGEIHQISNQGKNDLVFLAICVPPWTPEDSFDI